MDEDTKTYFGAFLFVVAIVILCCIWVNTA